MQSSLQILQSNLKAAIASHKAGDFSTAEQHYRIILRADPKQPQALHLLGILLYQKGQGEEGLKLALMASRLAPLVPQIWSDLGTIQKGLGKQKLAAKSYRQALTLHPDFPEAHFNLGMLLLEIDSIAAGIEHLRKAVDLGFEHPDALYKLSTEALTKGDIAASKKYLKKLAFQDPNHKNRTPFFSFAQAAIRTGRYEDASEILLAPIRRIHGLDGEPAFLPKTFNTTSVVKLNHDIAQLIHLRQQGFLDESYDLAVENLKKILSEIARMPGLVTLTTVQKQLIEKTYNRLCYFFSAPIMTESALNPNLNFSEIQNTFMARSDEPHIIDGFLSAQALAALQGFLFNSTIWWQLAFSDELGTSIRNGFSPPILMQVLGEVKKNLPSIFKSYELKTAWAYIYWGDRSGLDLHCDDGAVSINLWLTPDGANLSPQSSGLTFWNRSAPTNYFVTEDDVEKHAILETLLNEEGVKSIEVPYRCNRAAIFRSNMIHKTAETKFAAGYQNRRLNMTLIFGNRDDGQD